MIFSLKHCKCSYDESYYGSQYSLLHKFVILYPIQGRSQDFLKRGSSTSIELLEAGIWGHSPQPLRDFQYFNKSKLSKLLYFMQKVRCIKCPWDEGSTR